MNRKYLLSIAVIAYLSNSAIASDSYNIDEVVVSASGFSQEIQEAPATMNVITKKDLERKPYRDVAEAISDIPGVDLYASKGKSGSYNITMRGITGYTLVLVDGRRQGIGGEIGPNGFGEVMNAFLPPLSSIERIEVIKWPMSTLYGSEALGGVVNIITKKVSDEWGMSVGINTILNEDKQWGNTYGYNIYADGPVIDNKLGAVFRYSQSYRAKSEVTHRNSRGVEVPATQAQSPTKANNYNVGARLNYIHDDANRFTFDIDYGKNHYDNRKGQLGTLGIGARGGYEPTMDIDKIVTYLAHEGIYNGINLNSAIQYNRVSNDSRLVVARNNPYWGQNRDILAQDYIADTKAVIPIGQSNILSVGAEYKLERMRDKIASPSRFRQYIISVFAEDEYSILNNLRLTLGTRYNHHEAFGNNLSPRAYLVYNLNDNLTFKGGVSTGFKAPYVNRLIAGEYNYGGQGSIPIYGNPNLSEETSINYELSIGYMDSIFNASITGFMTEFKDKISSVSYNRGEAIPSVGVCGSQFTRCSQAINHGKVEHKGLEVSAGAMPINRLNLNLSYTYLDSEIKESRNLASIGKPETNSLKHNIVAKTDYNINNILTPWIKGEWQIDRYMGNTNINREYYKDIFLASLGAAVEINKNWNINAGIYNLFDKNFTDSYETYSNRGTLTYVNTYNRIEEGRRLYLSLNGRF